MKGITYYKLQSPYFGDVTKNCSLNGLEVDQNFFNLEGRDVKSITVENGYIVISFLNGDTINTSLESTITNTYDFDVKTGILTVTQNGKTQEIRGFVTADMIKQYVGVVSVDSTLNGNGKPFNPIGISSSQKTGFYKPVEKIIDTTTNEKLPNFKEAKIGERFLTVEKHCTLGLLYNYDGVKQIACDLHSENKGWRIPTKDDWDDMLNAIEVDDDDKNHNALVSNRFLGNVAGKLLKSQTMWKSNKDISSEDITADNAPKPSCNTPYYGEIGSQRYTCKVNNDGLDKFGFCVYPSGYADDDKQYDYFTERAWYWTATNHQYTNAFTKRFVYNTNKVYQDVTPTNFYLSLRFVKDYDGTNHYECEEILGSVYSTVLMPSQKKGNAIWTSVNVDLTNKQYKGIIPNCNDESLFLNKYFINEWDGKKWVRNELKEGESVVIKNTSTDKSIEYRVINGMLINASSFLFKEVMKAVDVELKNIHNKIDEEVTKITEVENELKENVNNLSVITSSHEEKLQDISNTIKSFEIDLVNTKTILGETIENFNNEIDGVKTIIENEEKRALEVETALNTKINEVENTLPQQEGTVFNEETGILTIKSGNETNDIKVQFSFNFGEI